jgi:transposase
MIPAGTKVYLSVAPADLRRSFDGLAAMAMSELHKDPTEGGLFVFLNKRATLVRVLFRDRHGWCLVAKRLDAGRFRRPQVKDGCFCWELDAAGLLSFLDDIDLTRVKRRSRPKSSDRGSSDMTSKAKGRHLAVVDPI